MQIHSSASDTQIWIVVPQGRLDASAAPELERALADLESRGTDKIVLNFSETHYISSSSLRIMLIHGRRLRLQGKGGLKLCCVPDRVAKVLCIVGFNQVFDTYPDEEQAIQSFQAHPARQTPRPAREPRDPEKKP